MWDNNAGNWGVVAAVMYDLLTFGLLFVGYRTLRALSRQADDDRAFASRQIELVRAQLSAAEQHHADQMRAMKAGREASQRPVLYPTKARMIESPSGKNPLILKLRNVGEGPATRVKVECWLTRDDSASGSAQALVDVIAPLLLAAETQPPVAVADVPIPLAARSTAETFLGAGSGGIAGESAWFELERAPKYVMLVKLHYWDLAGNEYVYPDEFGHLKGRPAPLTAWTEGGIPMGFL